ncbi:MAG: hypothetical protein IJ193_08745 [Bacilli bacterium]|nr:hypothetical protein [Bacilli bacterium]
MNWTWLRFQITDLQDDVYTVINENNETYQFRLHFYDLDLSVGDYLVVSSIYFLKFTEFGLEKYYFGPLNTQFSKKIDADHEYEKMMIEHGDGVIIYQRYYG